MLRPTPRRPVLRRFAAGALALVAAGATFTVGTGGAGAAAPAPGSRYVALGDSYAAGYGIGTSTGRPVAGCAQSTQDYPHQIAARLKLKLTDVTCSGAVTANIDSTAQDTGNGTAPLQDKALTRSTKLVTVTIGGNDLGFSSIASYCLAASARGPLVQHTNETNCKAHYAPTGGTDTLAATVRNTVVPRVARVLADIKDKAPHAAVYFVDYPAISTTKAASPNPATYPNSCYSSFLAKNSFPFTGIDTAYLESVERGLDAALKSRVARSHAHFVESYPRSLSHSACAGTAAPWMNGITLNGTKPAPGSLHPNLVGAQQLAAEALAAIGPRAAPGRSSSASSAASPTAAPARSGSLANSGTRHVVPLVVAGVLLVVVGAGLLTLTRRRHGRGAH